MARPLRLLLDSVIVIDHLNGHAAATDFLLQRRDQIAVSVVTRAEVLAGAARRSRSAIRRLLDQFPTLGIDAAIADLAAELRRRYRWKLADAFQAAIARHHRRKLVTRNTRDFPVKRHRFVLVPYAL